MKVQLESYMSMMINVCTHFHTSTCNSSVAMRQTIEMLQPTRDITSITVDDSLPCKSIREQQLQIVV